MNLMNKFLLFFPKYLIKLFLIISFVGIPSFSFSENELGVSTFMYHRFGEDRYPTTSVTKEQFQSHIKYIIENNIDVISLEEIISKLENDEKFNEKSIAFSVDDAYLSFFEYAWPIFKKYKIPVTLFVSTDIIDSNTAGYMSWSQIKQFIDEGGSIGQHTSTHLHMPLNSKKYVKEDLLNSHRSFIKNIGFVPKLFAYPYGETSLAIIELLKELNISHAFGQHSGVISSYENHYYLPRFSLNENFGTSDRFGFAVNSFPLQIDQFSPEDMFLKNNKRPLIELTLVDDLNNNELNCYSNPGGNWNSQEIIKISPLKFQIKLEEDFLSGRGKLNCTSKIDDKWHWFGYQFLVK